MYNAKAENRMKEKKLILLLDCLLGMGFLFGRLQIYARPPTK